MVLRPKDANNLKRRETNGKTPSVRGILPMNIEFCVRGMTGSGIFVSRSRNRADHAADFFRFNSFPVCEYRDEHRCRRKKKKNLFPLKSEKIKRKEKKREIDYSETDGEKVISSHFPPPSLLPSFFL